MKNITIGVRDLLSVYFGPKDFTYEPGLLNRLQEGVRGHKEATAARPANYQREVAVSGVYRWRDWTLTVRGRIDGLWLNDNELVVEEIKTTWMNAPHLDIPENDFYRGQLLLYCWFIHCAHPLSSIRGELVWWRLDGGGEIRCPLTGDVVSQGKDLFFQLARTWLAREVRQERWLNQRNQCLGSLPFPFPAYRPGQDKLQASVSQALTEKQDILVEAATGIGKTAAVLYPALSWLHQAPRAAKVFFLTAKTSGRLVVRETLERWQGLKLRTVFVEAKDRCCQREDRVCEECPLAEDFYTRAAKVLPGLMARGLVTEDLTLATALDHNLCPFELGLEAASLADLVVGDYNYVFDPLVQLKRFFGQGQAIPAVLLIDEAHNLVERGRDMFSADLAKKQILDLSREYKGQPLGTMFKELNDVFIKWGKELKEAETRVLELVSFPRGFKSLLEKLQEYLDQAQRDRQLSEAAGEFAQRLRGWQKLSQFQSEDHVLYVFPHQGDLILNLQCLNPGPLLKGQRGKAIAVAFSATLSPSQYYQELLGMEASPFLTLPSPFPRENRLFLHIPGIQTRYTVRDRYYPAIAAAISNAASKQPGNYLAFFPSYTYLEEVAVCLAGKLPPGIRLLKQRSGLSAHERKEFLEEVSGPGHNLGLAVLGGLFGEGIDLPGDKLIGAFIVGPGLPQVSPRQEFIRRHFENQGRDGFYYAYLVPGLLRVVQSAGRVIRSPQDRGIIVLLDDRFRERGYASLLPSAWLEEGLFTYPWVKRLQEFWN